MPLALLQVAFNGPVGVLACSAPFGALPPGGPAAPARPPDGPLYAAFVLLGLLGGLAGLLALLGRLAGSRPPALAAGSIALPASALSLLSLLLAAPGGVNALIAGVVLPLVAFGLLGGVLGVASRGGPLDEPGKW